VRVHFDDLGYNMLMRTTITIEDHLLQKAKEEAARTNRTLGELVAEGIRSVLKHPKKKSRVSSTSLPTFKGSGLKPGVDLDNGAGLLSLLEDRATFHS
jgi:hypothetical protein